MKPTSQPTTLRVGLLGLLLACTACPGSLEDPLRFLGDAGGGTNEGGAIADGSACPDIPSEVFAHNCITPGCHSMKDKIEDLDLESPGVASRIVGVCARGGGYLVDPTDPAHSVVYAKLTFAPPFGTRMPLGKRALDAPTLACVLAWVSAQQGTLQPCGDGGSSPDGASAPDAARD